MKLISGFVLVVACSLATQAQPTPQELVDRAMEAYEVVFAGVDSYLLTTESNGVTSMTYAERAYEGADALSFDSYIQTDSGNWVRDFEAPFGGDLYRMMLEGVREQDVQVREVELAGERVYVVEVLTPEEDRREDDQLEHEERYTENVSVYFGIDHPFLIGLTLSGRALLGDEVTSIETGMQFSGFRTTNGLTMPHAVTFYHEGLRSAFSNFEAQMLIGAQEWMAEASPGERAEVLEMEADALEMFEVLSAGERYTEEIRIIDIQVNVPMPE